MELGAEHVARRDRGHEALAVGAVAEHDGLGILAGEISDLVDAPKLPHIGWNLVEWATASPLVDGLGTGRAFYHVHSLAAHPADETVVLGYGAYGERFVTAVASGSVFGAQFHPEKSSVAGLRLLENFTRICTRVPVSSAQ